MRSPQKHSLDRGGLCADGGNDDDSAMTVSAETFAREAGEVRSLVERLGRPATEFTPSWGGLIVLGGTEAEAEEKRARLSPGPNVLVGGPERVAEGLQPYLAAGAEWITVGPVDSSNPENAAILGERVLPLLR